MSFSLTYVYLFASIISIILCALHQDKKCDKNSSISKLKFEVGELRFFFATVVKFQDFKNCDIPGIFINLLHFEYLIQLHEAIISIMNFERSTN